MPLTEETIEQAKKCDAVLMGSIGGDAKTSPWYQLEPVSYTHLDVYKRQGNPQCSAGDISAGKAAG